MREMQTAGLRYITHVLKCVRHITIDSDWLTSGFQGYLDIVRCLCERGGAASTTNGIRGVDVRSKDGWTPLSEQVFFKS